MVTTNSDNNDKELLVSQVTVFNYQNITTYTFVVLEENDDNSFRNLILRTEDNVEFEPFMITYDPTENWLNSNQDITPFDGKMEIYPYTGNYQVVAKSGSSMTCTYAMDFIWECEVGRNHPPGHPDCFVGGAEVIGVNITETCIPSYPGEGTGGDSGGDNGTPWQGGNNGDGDGEGTGGNGDGDDLPIDGPITTKPIKELESEEEIIRKRECKKIKKIIDEFNPEFMTKLRDLKNKDGLNFESGVAVFEDDTVQEYQGSEEESTIQNYPISPTSDYIAVGHVHNENDVKPPTYSVFSLQDLEWVARKYEQGYLNTSKFVAFLATADGNYLALTINSASKFWEFFRYIDSAFPDATVQERQEAAVKLNEVSGILDKYYKSLTNPLIKENAQGTTNNRYQLRYFMQFLEEANAGVTVFETSENFDSFSELELNGTNVVGNETPCEL